MKHKTVGVVKEGRGFVKITTTIDDEAGTTTHDVFSRQGRSKSTLKLVWNTQEDKLLTINGSPVPKDNNSLEAKLAEAAAAMIRNLVTKAEAREPDISKHNNS